MLQNINTEVIPLSSNKINWSKKENIDIEKGVILTEKFLEEHEELIQKYANFFSAYPDLFIDLITPSESNFKLFFYQRIFLRACLRFRYHFCTACLTKGTPVLTEYGMMPIEEVKGNIRVWTKDGWQTPENLNIRDWHGNFTTIGATNCLEEEITVTDDHKFFTINENKGKIWEGGHKLFDQAIKQYNQDEIEWVEAQNLTKENLLLSPIETYIRKNVNFNFNKKIIKVDSDFCEWLGIFIKCGFIDKTKIYFNIMQNELLSDRIKYLTKKIFNITQIEVFDLLNTNRIITFNSDKFLPFLKEVFDEDIEKTNLKNRYIPKKLLYIEPKIQLQIIKGMIETSRLDIKGIVSSTILIEGIRNILHRNYINPNITKINGEYTVIFSQKFLNKVHSSISNCSILSIECADRNKSDYPVLVDNKLFMTSQILKVETSKKDIDTVYCLQMPNDSFNICGVEGHNCRAFSKTFISILALFLECMFLPGTKRFICAPGKAQSAKIAKDKIFEIFDKIPLLKKEIVGEGNFGKDYVTLTFRNKSIFDVVGALDSERGGRRHGGLIDEIRDHDGDLLNSVVLPLMNVSRTTPTGIVNKNEVNQQQLYMGSAGIKTSYAYDKLIDILELSILAPGSAFVWGCDYRVPVMHGLLDIGFITELKMSPTYNEETFAREYLSVWTGGSEESWFNYDKMQKYRKLKNPETHASNRHDHTFFYLISVDVGRLNDQTVVTIFKVNVLQEKYLSSVVNIYVLGKDAQAKSFERQAVDLKKIILAFNPQEVVIDTNGLGLGLADEMIKTQVSEDGEVFPPYGFTNDEDYQKIQPRDAICILYGIKANGPLNSKIHGNAYSRLAGGLVRFLIKEQEAKSSLLSTIVGQKMSPEQRIKRLMPHEMTTKLFEEMANLRLKRSGVGLDIVLERINERFPKDKFSSFEYGLWRIKELEEHYYKNKRRRSIIGSRQLVFFTGG